MGDTKLEKVLEIFNSHSTWKSKQKSMHKQMKQRKERGKIKEKTPSSNNKNIKNINGEEEKEGEGRGEREGMSSKINRPMIHDTVRSENPFGPSLFYAFDGVLFEIIPTNQHIASLTL